MDPLFLASLPVEPHPLSLLPFVLMLLCIALLPLIVLPVTCSVEP